MRFGCWTRTVEQQLWSQTDTAYSSVVSTRRRSRGTGTPRGYSVTGSRSVVPRGTRSVLSLAWCHLSYLSRSVTPGIRSVGPVDDRQQYPAISGSRNLTTMYSTHPSAARVASLDTVRQRPVDRRRRDVRTALSDPSSTFSVEEFAPGVPSREPDADPGTGTVTRGPLVETLDVQATGLAATGRPRVVSARHPGQVRSSVSSAPVSTAPRRGAQ